MTRIDLNCDMGESYGPWKMGDDEGIMPSISSANVACGAHAGDPDVMLATVRLAKRYGVRVGAHPGYADLRGFGRRSMKLTPDEVRALVLTQVGALFAVARSESVDLSHVKAHGALYNQACEDAQLAGAVARALADFSRELSLFGLPGSKLEEAAGEQGILFVAEGFADRAYEPNGLLRDRKHHDSLLSDPVKAAENALNLARGRVVACDGSVLDMRVDTLCIHGDTYGAPSIARQVRAALEAAGFEIRAAGL